MSEDPRQETGRPVAGLEEIERLMKEGAPAAAIEALIGNRAGGGESNEKDFLLGHAYRILGDPRQAVRHFTDATLAERPHFPAAEEAISILARHGYLREARYLLNHVVECGRRSGAFPSSRTDRLFSLIDSCGGGTVVAIHQPAYLPWLGYFHKIFYADKFVIHDAVEYSKKSFIKRTLIRKGGSNESTYLTIPAQKHSDFCLIKEMNANDSIAWREEHLRKIKAAYAKSRHFSEIYPRVDAAFEKTRGKASLVEITHTFTQAILEMLGMERPMFFSSSLLQNGTFENAHDKNMGMCRMLDGDIYFSGSGARRYQAGKSVPAGMKLIYQNIWKYLEANPYVGKDVFINGLSTLDALFHVGPEKIIDLFEQYDNPSNDLVFS